MSYAPKIYVTYINNKESIKADNELLNQMWVMGIIDLYDNMFLPLYNRATTNIDHEIREGFMVILIEVIACSNRHIRLSYAAW